MWQCEKKWSDAATGMDQSPAPPLQGEKVLRRHGTLVLFFDGQEYGLKDLDTGKELCPRSPHLQTVQEVFEHSWRRRYAGDVSKGFQ